MDNFEIYGQLSIDYGQLSMYGQLSIWTIVHDGQLIVHAWTIVHGPLWTIVHTMDNCPLSMSMYTRIAGNWHIQDRSIHDMARATSGQIHVL